ncbi:MAG: oligoribonuclease [Xanthomonadales bacterium]|nr:oligoribonuclease [Xanthomonadales bacterium]
MAAEKQTRLIWIDLEMTGLDTINDTILEIATIVTDAELNVLAKGPVCAIRHDDAVLKAMDDWNRSHHTDSGLWQRVVFSSYSMSVAESETIQFLKEWVEKGLSPMCGNSICQDRRFLHRLMPELESWFHDRNLDVSTIKILANQWLPAELQEYEKENRHEALSDIRESIEELKYFRQFMGEFAGQDK